MTKLNRNRRPHLKTLIAALRSRVSSGDASAMSDLAMWLQEGFRDRKGRSLIRGNPGYAFRLFKHAAEQGQVNAFASLGLAYDNGLGTQRNKKKAAYWYMRALRNGESIGAANLATVYRDAGNLRRAFSWWMRAAAMSDGDSMVDAGYCYQYGIGVHKNIAAARRLYRRAIAARDITMWGREEALYHLGVSYVDAGKPKLALPFLGRAAKDADYPEAEAVFEQFRSKLPIEPCRCRRFILKTLRGHTVCPVHPRKTRR